MQRLTITLQLKQLDPFIGTLDLQQVHTGSLQDFIAKRRQDGVKTKTLNMALAVVRRVLNLAASEWSVRGLHPVDVFVRAHRKVGESRPDRVPQKSRDHLASAQDGLAAEALTN